MYWKIVDNGDDTANVYFSDTKLDDDFVCWPHIDKNGNEIPYCYMSIYNSNTVGYKSRSLSGATPTTSAAFSSEIARAKSNNLTNDEIGQRVGKSAGSVVNTMRLLKLPEEAKTALTDLFRHYVPGTVAQNLVDHAKFTGGKLIVSGVNLTQTQAADLTKAFKSKFFLLPTEISASTFPQEC